MSLLTSITAGVLYELKANCCSASSARMAKDKKPSVKPSSRISSNSVGSTIIAARLNENIRNQRPANVASGNHSNLAGTRRPTAVFMHLPWIPSSGPSDLLVEIYLFSYLMVSLLIQNVNIYRQNWYLVDYDLILFSAVVLGRIVLWRLLTMLGHAWSRSLNYKFWISTCVEWIGKLGILVMAIHLLLELVFNYSLPCCLYLAYPVFLYTTLFGFTLDPHQERLRLYRTFPNSPHAVRTTLNHETPSTHSGTTGASAAANSNGGGNQASGASMSSHTDHGSSNANHNSAPTENAFPIPKEEHGQSQPENLRYRKNSADRPGYAASAGGFRQAPISTSSQSPPMDVDGTHWVSNGQPVTSSLLMRILPWRSRLPHAASVNGDRPATVALSASSHSLMSSPDAVRQEVECLWADCVVRIKQVVFQAVLCAYYAGFLPMQMLKNDQLYFQPMWCWVHTGFILCNSLLLLAIQLVPADYCCSLYKCALQLGFWEVQSGETSAPHTWSAMSSWPLGSVVRHQKGVFRATGSPATVAIPGDGSHTSFYLLFMWALHIPRWCCYAAGIIVLVQMYSLWKFHDYIQSVGLFWSLVCSLYPYYHLSQTTWLLSWSAAAQHKS